MGKVNGRITLNGSGIRSLLKSEEMQAICEEYAQAALSRLGSGYEVTSMVGKTRCNSEVAAVTGEAKKENMEKNTILKALK